VSPSEVYAKIKTHLYLNKKKLLPGSIVEDKKGKKKFFRLMNLSDES
jgi:hypothetical protein